MTDMVSTGAKRPYVSLCAITHDGALGTLGRMLKSVLERPGGPAVQEVVLGFNGKDDEKFFDVLNDIFQGFTRTFDIERRDCALPGNHTLDVVIYKSEWVDDFSVARNELHAKTSGVWHFWLDADDQFVPGDDPQVIEEGRRAQVPENILRAPFDPKKALTLADFLKLQEDAGANCIALPYHYVVDGAGKPLQRQWKPRILKWDAGWTWKNRVHEDLVPTFGNRVRNAVNALMLIRHAPEENVQVRLRRNAELNAKIAEDMKARGEELDYRTLFNVGAIAYDDREWPQAIEALTASAAKAERAGEWMEALVALDLLARASLMIGKPDQAIAAGFQMVKLNANRPEGYLTLVAAYYSKQAWSFCARWYDVSQTIPMPPVVAVDNVVERTVWPMCWAAEAVGNLGFHDRAAELAEKALALAPDDAIAQRTVEGVRWVKEQVDAMVAVKTLVRFHLSNGDLLRARAVLTAAPAWEEEHFADLRGEIASVDASNMLEVGLKATGGIWTAPLGPARGKTRNTSWTAEGLLDYARSEGHHVEQLDTDDSGNARLEVAEAPVRRGFGDALPVRARGVGRTIDIYAPIHNEPWRPEQARTQGVGGSEEAIVFLSEELVRRGYRVRVYGPAIQTIRVRVVNGVEWRRFSDFVADEKHDIVIGHRAPWMTQNFPNCQELLIWHHDHTYLDEAFNAVTAPKGKHLFVSQFQAQLLAEMIPGTLFHGAVINNGVPAEQVIDVDEAKRNPLKVVYASQPIRGLRRLLEIWPEILAIHPEAELHAFYGRLTNALAAQVSPTVRAELEKVEALLPLTKNVVDHGRVGQLALMEEMRTAGVLAYPCGYPEVSAITPMRAAAAGCIPVLMTYGNAMSETQPDLTYATAVMWEDGGREIFKALLLKALVDKTFDRAALISKVRAGYTWSAVADRLESIIGGEALVEVTTPRESTGT